jgi:16S rRNA (cytosine1402-N4)-methyltransferase
MIAQRGDMRSQESGRIHTPVLVSAVQALAAAEPAHEAPAALSGWFVDGTLGGGGHARALLELFPNLRLFGLDQDPEALEVARQELAEFAERVAFRRGRLSQLEELLAADGIAGPLGMLLDLGASSLHFDRAERGFSFQADGPLDMRMDPSRDRTAADIVNGWDESDLADLFYYEGGEHGSRRVARAIVEARRRVPFRRTSALADLIANVLGSRGVGRIHPATRCFQALRRAVNEEGEELIAGLEAGQRVLAPGGRLLVISFHEGEDRIVKRFLQAGARDGSWSVLTRKPVVAEAAERRRNPRARSAKLRCAERRGQPAAGLDAPGRRPGRERW